MKYARLTFLLLLVLLPASVWPASTNLLPGVTYYDGKEALTGKLVFLLSSEAAWKSNTLTSAAIYEFDLAQKKLRKVTDAPWGLFIGFTKGGAYGVVFQPGEWRQNSDTNVFIYSESLQQKRVVSLNGQQKKTCLIGNHAFIEVERTNRTTLIDYDIVQNQQRSMEFADATQWQYQHYDRIHSPRGLTNILHFYYKGYGKKLGTGKDYRDGFYSFKIDTGDTQWVSDSIDKDDEESTIRDAKGRFIYFEGPDAPRIGFKLVCSPWDYLETERLDPKGEKVKVLKSFTKLPLFLNRPYLISQTSPDGRYVFVRLQEPSVPKSTEQSGWMNTYILLDAETGENRVLFKEDVGHFTKGSISAVLWVE